MKRVLPAPWWDARSPRERILLGILAILAAGALLLVLVIRPLVAARAHYAADIRSYDMLAERLRIAGPEGVTASRVGPAARIVTDIATANGLTVTRVEPESGRLRVVFGDASFEAVMRWVAELERTSRLRIGEAQIERTEGGDGVAAQFLLAGE